MTAASIIRESDALRLIVSDGVRRRVPYALSCPLAVCVLEGPAMGWRVAGTERWIDASGILLLNAFVPLAELGGAGGRRRVVTALFRRRWIGRRLMGRRGFDPQRPFAQVVAPLSRELRVSFAAAADAQGARAFEAAAAGLAVALIENYAVADVPGPARALDYRIRRALERAAARPGRRTGLADMLAASGLSRSRFFELFGECLGMAPQEYLDALTLEAALDALGASTPPIGALAGELGFANADGFTRFVRREIGVTPRDCRKAMRGG